MAAWKNPPDADSLSWGRALASRHFYRVTRLFQCIVGLRATVPIAWSWNVKSVLNIHWKDWCWSWHSNTLAIWCEVLTHWKRPWCWEGLKAGGEGDDREWDGWMASLTHWMWVWVNSGNWWWTGRPGVLQSVGSQRVGHDWGTEWSWNLGQRSQGQACFLGNHLCYLRLVARPFTFHFPSLEAWRSLSVLPASQGHLIHFRKDSMCVAANSSWGCFAFGLLGSWWKCPARHCEDGATGWLLGPWAELWTQSQSPVAP